MPNFNDQKEVAQFLADIDFAIVDRSEGTFTQNHVAYHCDLTKSGTTYHTIYQSNPRFSGEPNVVDIMSATAMEGMDVRGRNIDEFADEFGYTKPSEAIRAYEGCKKGLKWLRDDLVLSFEDISQLVETLGEYSEEVSEAVEAIKKERAAQYELVHPEPPKGFVTIDSLKEGLDLGDYGDQVPDYSDDYITDAIQAVADDNIDVYYSALLKWLPDNYEWISEADSMGLLEGAKGDIFKMIQMAQYECFSQDMYDHQEDICKNATLEALVNEGVYAVSEEVADALLNDVDYAGADTFSELFEDAKEQIQNIMCANLSAMFGDDDRTEEIAEEIVENNDYTANPCALSVKGVREVKEKGLGTAITARWKEKENPSVDSPSLGAVVNECRDASNALGSDDELNRRDDPNR